MHAMHSTLIAVLLWLYWALRVVIWYVTDLLEINPAAAAAARRAVTLAAAAAAAAGARRQTHRRVRRRVLCAFIVCTEAGMMAPLDVTDHLNSIMMTRTTGFGVSEYFVKAMRFKQQRIHMRHPSKLALHITTMDLEEITLHGPDIISSELWIDNNGINTGFADIAGIDSIDASIHTEVLG